MKKCTNCVHYKDMANMQCESICNKHQCRVYDHAVAENCKSFEPKAVGQKVAVIGGSYVHMREFIYGLDYTEHDENEEVILYSSKAEAQLELDLYINEVNEAFELGNMDEPYQNDCSVMAVDVYEMTYQPETCPVCGCRTNFEQSGTMQKHDCPDCKLKFIVQ